MKKLPLFFRTLMCLTVSVLLLFSCMLAGCDPLLPDENDPSLEQPDNPDKEPDKEPEKPFSVVYRSGYKPEKFGEVTNEITELGAGVHLVANKLKKTNGQDVVVYAVEVDLKKANIVAGTKDNVAEGFSYTKTTPYQMAQAWEKDTGGHVYMSLNADFFGGYCVNAFVKDGVIVKDSHNDEGKYDYRQGADVPASAPMLFGVKGTTAQIAPIRKYEGDPASPSVKEQLVKAKLSYKLTDGENVLDFQENGKVSSDFITYRSSGGAKQKGGYAVKVDNSKGIFGLTVLEVTHVTEDTRFSAGDGYGYLVTKDEDGAYGKYLSSLKAGDKVELAVTSPDGTWNGYETILGCRQALVVDNKIADTVEKENTNGAQSPDVPRSAVGIKPNGNVVIFAVESMYYGTTQPDRKGKPPVEGDTHGMNLPELAEFAYYYGCTQAANFDGGGSTQLAVRGEGEETAKVVIRSADTAGTGLNDTRPVMNAILVTSKQEN